MSRLVAFVVEIENILSVFFNKNNVCMMTGDTNASPVATLEKFYGNIENAA